MCKLLLKSRSSFLFECSKDIGFYDWGAGGSDLNGRMNEDVVSLLEEKMIQLSIKSSMLIHEDRPSLICSVWKRKTYNLDAFRAQMR